MTDGGTHEAAGQDMLAPPPLSRYHRIFDLLKYDDGQAITDERGENIKIWTEGPWFPQPAEELEVVPGAHLHRMRSPEDANRLMDFLLENYDFLKEEIGNMPAEAIPEFSQSIVATFNGHAEKGVAALYALTSTRDNSIAAILEFRIRNGHGATTGVIAASPEHRPEGVRVSDGRRALARHCLQDLGIPRLLTAIEPTNAKSIRLTKRVGGRLDPTIDPAEVEAPPEAQVWVVDHV